MGEVHYHVKLCFGGSKKFKSGRKSITHEEGAGLPSTSTADDNIQQAREMVQENKRFTTDEVTHLTNISHGSAHKILQDELGFYKANALWVPRNLTEKHKLTLLSMFTQSLQQRMRFFFNQNSHRR
ncbi:hypothetical protein AVEN_271104-1 [Araneus ventricosus]|uniref:Histone-lysine N-methyltransferase SETMAR n=1 Tax=Araneus ventricosus TaxID=182803 RepID=A0A4Y2E6T0_ARAVE|nr:hypothetical protein AVEN_271104-1 [Araneus ventricosus]